MTDIDSSVGAPAGLRSVARHHTRSSTGPTARFVTSGCSTDSSAVQSLLDQILLSRHDSHPFLPRYSGAWFRSTTNPSSTIARHKCSPFSACRRLWSQPIRNVEVRPNGERLGLHGKTPPTHRRYGGRINSDRPIDRGAGGRRGLPRFCREEWQRSVGRC